MIIKKMVTIQIILLFIGVAFAPSIQSNVVEDELVEFDVEFCGLGKKDTVQLTQDEADEVEQLFDEIHQQLENVESREEAEEIFKDAVVKLDKYGLLGGLSIEQAQRLVARKYQNPRVGKLIERISDRNQGIFKNSNFLCLIAGVTSETSFGGPFYWAIPTNYLMIYWIIHYISPIELGGIITFGRSFWVWEGPSGVPPANGFLFTLGLIGVKIWNDNIYGQIGTFRVPSPLGSDTHYIGGIGFIGIKVYSPSLLNVLYLGSALWVRVDSERP